MPSQLALIIVTAFVAFALRNEHKQSSDLSPATWIPTLWLLSAASKQLGRWFNITSTMEAGSPPDRLFLLVLGISGLIILFKRQFSWAEAIKKNYLLFLVLFYMLISTSWSTVPFISFKRFSKEVIALIMACLLFTEKERFKAISSILRRVIYIGLPFSFLVIHYFPYYGREYNRWSGELMWVGITSQKNGLALLCAVSALFLIWSLWENIRKHEQLTSKLPLILDIFMLLLSIYLFMGPKRTLSYSATSLVSLLAGLAVLIFSKLAVKKGAKIKTILMSFALIIILIGIFMPFSGQSPSKSITGLVDRDETLTGRLNIWKALIPFAKKNILLGFGFGGFWTTRLREDIAAHSHNGYLDAILDLGIIGLALYLLFILSVMLKTVKLIGTQKIDPSFFFLSLVFVILVRSIAETSLGEFSTFSTGLLLFWSLLVNIEDNTISNEGGTITLQ